MSLPDAQARYSVHRAVVTAVTQLTPRFVRVTFGGPGLRGFRTTGAAAKIKVFLPPEPNADLVLPIIDANHQLVYPEGARPAIVRTYTVRNHRHETGEVDIDFVVHLDGPAGRWASTAQPGSVIGLSDGGGQLPLEASDILFVGDLSSLPSIETLVESLEANTTSRIILLAHDSDDVIPVDKSPSGTACQWVHVPHGADAGEALISAVRDALKYRRAEHIWAAGESSSLKPLRRFLRTEAGFAKEASPVVGYWKHTMTTDEFESRLIARAREAMPAGTVLTPEDIAEMSVDV